jgi:protein-S-isoprenylcysteine O-methyltransferase Ste14
MKPQKATTVVTTGIYQYTRNPMYLGLFLFLAALAVKLGNPTAMPFLPAFVAYMNRFQIAPEERILEAQFGDTYTDYKSRVRRWI